MFFFEYSDAHTRSKDDLLLKFCLFLKILGEARGLAVLAARDEVFVKHFIVQRDDLVLFRTALGRQNGP